ncbi:MAG: hypothetical protein AAF677_06880 [Pseudomonadota bacterium]
MIPGAMPGAFLAPMLAPWAAMAQMHAQAMAAGAAMAAAGAQAMTGAAAGRAPFSGPISVNAQFNAPFGRDFSQDIDPVTTWMLPFFFGFLPATARAAEVVTEFRSLRALASRAVGTAEAETVSDLRSAAVSPTLRLSSGDLAAMQDALTRLDRLIGPVKS